MPAGLDVTVPPAAIFLLAVRVYVLQAVLLKHNDIVLASTLPLESEKVTVVVSVPAEFLVIVQ